MCLNDLKRSLAHYREEDYSDAIFRLQLSVENACKSILSFLGIEFEKTHFPSAIIGKLLSDKGMLKRLKQEADIAPNTSNLLRFISRGSGFYAKIWLGN
ncbi:MAG: HEPN domain-containing protein [Nitrososphaeria archaeon]